MKNTKDLTVFTYDTASSYSSNKITLLDELIFNMSKVEESGIWNCGTEVMMLLKTYSEYKPADQTTTPAKFLFFDIRRNNLMPENQIWFVTDTISVKLQINFSPKFMR